MKHKSERETSSNFRRNRRLCHNFTPNGHHSFDEDTGNKKKPEIMQFYNKMKFAVEKVDQTYVTYNAQLGLLGLGSTCSKPSQSGQLRRIQILIYKKFVLNQSTVLK